MKKMIALTLVLVMVAAMAVGCGGNKTDNNSNIESALVLLENVWGKYADEEKPYIRGGDFSEENLKENAPGKYSLTDAEAIQSELVISVDTQALVDDAASMIHGMNANTFTCGAFRVKNSADVNKVVSAMEESIQNNRWMCGIPETVLIMTVDNYVVSCFGATELINTFKTNMQAAYADAKVAVEEPIV